METLIEYKDEIIASIASLVLLGCCVWILWVSLEDSDADDE